MNFTVALLLSAIALVLGMLAFLELGRRLGNRQIARDPTGAGAGAGVVDGAIFALFGLLVAFTFSGAATRFDWRRNLVVEETNDIGTAYLRLDLLPVDVQPKLREAFRKYVDSRLATYRKLPDLEAAKVELAHSSMLQGEIWTQAVAACQAKGDPATTSLVLPALNSMIDITTTQNMATKLHPPMIVFVLLFGLALLCSLMAGYGMAGSKWRNWSRMFGFAAITGLTFYVIVDIEFPRQGLIRVDTTDQIMVELRESMK
jgi:hypothetical protein